MIGVYRETVIAILARCAQGATMFAVAVSVIWRLTPAEQGFFFAFMSLGALLQLGDFGMSYAVLQTSSHLAAVGQKYRLSGFISRALRLNFRISLVVSIMVFILGAIVFSASNKFTDHSEISWMAPWILYAGVIFLTQITVPAVAFIEGGVSITDAWKFRLFQEIISGLIFVGALIYNCGLWSLSAYGCARFLSAACWLSTKKLRHDPAKSPPFCGWRGEVWPFQWKIGLSSLSGYLIFQAMVPIVLVEHGPVIAGRFAFSLAMMNMILLVTTVWPMSQAARYGRLISKMQFRELRQKFLVMSIGSTLFAGMIAILLSLCVWWLTDIGVSFVNRLSDTLTTDILLATAVVHHVVHCYAVLLRAERREPLLWISVFGGLFTVVAIWIAARFGGVREIALTNIVCAAIGIPIVYAIYQRRLTYWKGCQENYPNPEQEQ